MEALRYVLIALQILTSLFLIAVVLLQSGKRSGLSGSIAGVADTFMSKNTGRTWDARLAKMTKWVAGCFIFLTLSLSLV